MLFRLVLLLSLELMVLAQEDVSMNMMMYANMESPNNISTRYFGNWLMSIRIIKYTNDMFSDVSNIISIHKQIFNTLEGAIRGSQNLKTHFIAKFYGVSCL